MVDGELDVLEILRHHESHPLPLHHTWHLSDSRHCLDLPAVGGSTERSFMTDPPVQGETEHVSEGPGLLTDHPHHFFTLEYKKIEENVGWIGLDLLLKC